MAPRRREPSPTEADSGSDVEFNLDVQDKSSDVMTQALTSIDKWKSKRSGIQKGIDKDYTNKVIALKNKIKAHYRDELQKISDHNKQQLERLIAALEKRMACEENISKKIDSLRDDTAHLAMLLDAVYAGRKEAATQAARSAHPDLLQN